MSRNIEGDHTPPEFRHLRLTGEEMKAKGVAEVPLKGIEFVECVVLTRSDVDNVRAH